MKYILHRKKKNVDECDGGAGGFDCGAPMGDFTMGMGDAYPVGGPDRWDMGLGFRFDTSLPKKKKKIKAKRRK